MKHKLKQGRSALATLRWGVLTIVEGANANFTSEFDCMTQDCCVSKKTSIAVITSSCVLGQEYKLFKALFSRSGVSMFSNKFSAKNQRSIVLSLL